MVGNADVHGFSIACAQTNYSFGRLDGDDFKDACGGGRITFHSRQGGERARPLRVGLPLRLFARQRPC